ncbi:hypothetical protein BURKHO8Y_140003 [Burkholderia sp. 8Y]|nr:hypothetical protein BURKHO8Y_140003 [Burkholderia sp. 8Y]
MPHQQRGIPQAAEEAGLRHVLQRDERELRDVLAVRHHADRADLLALLDRRDQQIVVRDGRLDLVAEALRHGDVLIGLDARLHVVRRALVHARRFDHLIGLEETQRVIRGVAVVQHLEAVLHARRFLRLAHHDRDETTARVRHARQRTLGRRDQAVARRFRVAGLEAVDARVEPQQAVAVRLLDLVVREILHREDAVVLGEVPDQARRQHGEVARRRVVLRIGHAVHVGIVRVLHADALRGPVHQIDEVGLAAADEFRERNGRVVARLHDHAVDEIVHRDRLLRFDEHARLVRPHAAHGLARHDRLVHVDLLGLEGVEDEVRGHQLGERRGFHALVRIAGCEHLIAGGIDEHPRMRRHGGRRHLRERARGGEHGRQHDRGLQGAARNDGIRSGSGERRKRKAGREKAHRIGRQKEHRRYARDDPKAAKRGLNRQTVHAGRALRLLAETGTGCRGEGAHIRQTAAPSVLKRLFSNVAWAGTEPALWRRAFRRSVKTESRGEKILRHYTRGQARDCRESARIQHRFALFQAMP